VGAVPARRLTVLPVPPDVSARYCLSVTRSAVDGHAGVGSAPPSLVDGALEHIRERIVSGELRPGARLKERDLAVEIGMSRVPVREALRALATEGFVTHVPRSGMVVSDIDSHILDQIFEIREALEPYVCELAVRKSTDREVEGLLALVAEGQAALDRQSKAEFDSANTRFHDALSAMAHNDVLIDMLRPLNSRLHWLLRQNDRDVLMQTEHAAIADAIAARDVRRARRESSVHVRTSKRVALAQLFQSTRP